MKKYFLYKHTFPNGKVYIGITSRVNPERRWLGGRGYQTQKLMYNAIQQYGWENIKHEILFSDIPETEIDDLERKIIAEYQSNNPEYGYNILSGGLDGYDREGCSVIMYSLQGKYIRTFATILDACDYLNVASGGSISAACQGKRKSMYGYQWRYYTPDFSENIERISYESIPGIKKSVEQYSKEGKYIAQYASITEAAKITGVQGPDIGRVCRGERKSAGGYVWRFRCSTSKT